MGHTTFASSFALALLLPSTFALPFHFRSFWRAQDYQEAPWHIPAPKYYVPEPYAAYTMTGASEGYYPIPPVYASTAASGYTDTVGPTATGTAVYPTGTGTAVYPTGTGYAKRDVEERQFARFPTAWPTAWPTGYPTGTGLPFPTSYPTSFPDSELAPILAEAQQAARFGGARRPNEQHFYPYMPGPYAPEPMPTGPIATATSFTAPSAPLYTASGFPLPTMGY